MARGRRFLGQVVLVLAMMAAGFVGAKLGLLGTQEARASHNFSDVPDSAFYHDFVQFLVDNGITVGCGPHLFCGEQAVTRGQTAVFLEKLSDLVDQKVNAQVAGLSAQVAAVNAKLAGFQIVHNSISFASTTEVNNGASCPAGTRSLAGGGSTDAFNLMLTDLSIGTNFVSVRWESDNDILRTGTSDAWVLCAPV
jgi:hypothetical protein